MTVEVGQAVAFGVKDARREHSHVIPLSVAYLLFAGIISGCRARLFSAVVVHRGGEVYIFKLSVGIVILRSFGIPCAGVGIE